MGIIITGILVCAYVSAPFPIQLLLLAINLVLPDTIFAIDEIIMAASSIKKIIKIEETVEFVCDHKVLSAIIALLIAALFIMWLIL